MIPRKNSTSHFSETSILKTFPVFNFLIKFEPCPTDAVNVHLLQTRIKGGARLSFQSTDDNFLRCNPLKIVIKILSRFLSLTTVSYN